MLSDEVFSQRFDPMLLQKIFQTPFSNNNNKKKRKRKKKEKRKKHTAGGMPETHTLCKQVVAEYLNVWSR